MSNPTNDSTYRNSGGSWNPFAILCAMLSLPGDCFGIHEFPFSLKMLLPIAAAIYWVWPLDLLPGLPFDDIAILLLALRAFVQLAPQEAVRGATNRSNDGEPVIDTTWRRVD